MEMPLCKLCDKPSELKNSHVIGKSVFRNIIKNSGKHYGIVTDHESGKIIRSTDQWATLMLCGECESLLNSKYENYSLWVLKNKQHGVKHQEKNHYWTIRNVNQHRLMMYVLSIFWRASISDHKVFKDVNLPVEISEYLKNCLLGKMSIDTKIYSVRISKLIDDRNYYSKQVIEGIITNIGRREMKKGLCYIMVFAGYYFEIFLDCLQPFERFGSGVLRKNKTVLNLPYHDILSIPELFNSLKKTREIAIKDIDELTFLDLKFEHV
ncbi:hypothetical protein [Acinetobacter bereziniae]|uniref:hypothetical protein n=1 Tax=Acinetobacter bereziniae TaxID=106648 RepID=UPI00073E79AF|nr:hypothetical protein [Acinetobacter bereziniae]RSZ25734.1 hypothetical protein NDM229_006750 [Acinetobacter bereziniae]